MAGGQYQASRHWYFILTLAFVLLNVQVVLEIMLCA